MIDLGLPALAHTAATAFLLAFPALFSIINPIGGAFIFGTVAKEASSAQRATLAGRVALFSLLVMLGALWVGAYILNFFGVSLYALRIAGGIVVAASGWTLLSAGDQRKEHKAGTPDDPLQMAFFPLTLPLTTGPGTIAVAITLGAGRPASGVDLLAFMLGVTVAAVANAVLIWIAYRSADPLTRLLGATGREVVVRLSAFLLLCIGIQIVLTGVGDVVAHWRAA